MLILPYARRVRLPFCLFHYDDYRCIIFVIIIMARALRAARKSVFFDMRTPLLKRHKDIIFIIFIIQRYYYYAIFIIICYAYIRYARGGAMMIYYFMLLYARRAAIKILLMLFDTQKDTPRRDKNIFPLIILRQRAYMFASSHYAIPLFIACCCCCVALLL